MRKTSVVLCLLLFAIAPLFGQTAGNAEYRDFLNLFPPLQLGINAEISKQTQLTGNQFAKGLFDPETEVFYPLGKIENNKGCDWLFFRLEPAYNDPENGMIYTDYSLAYNRLNPDSLRILTPIAYNFWDFVTN